MSSKAAIADSGTATKMGDSFDEDTCACMWGELYDANDGQLKNFEDLTNLWYRNLKVHVKQYCACVCVLRAS